MQDRRLAPLEEVAARYADIRDQRQELLREEVSLKGTALTLMKRFGKTVYHRNGITITVLPGEDSIRVKVKLATEDEGETSEETAEILEDVNEAQQEAEG